MESGPPTPVFELPVLAPRPGTQLHTCAVECRGGCCRYFSLPIETPRSGEDFDAVRWYLMHEDTHVYKFESTWYLMVLRRCRHLTPQNLCGAYDRRPAICADYDPSDCEHVDSVGYELYFRSDDELDRWLELRRRARSDAARKGWRRRRRPARA